MILKPKQHKNALHHRVEDITKLSELLPLLEHIDIDHLKDFTDREIKNFSSDRARSAYYHSLSISAFFPDDIQQHILSFRHCNQNRTVCLKWNELNFLNEINMIRSQLVYLTQTRILLPRTPVWMMHKHRDHLLDIELDHGLNGMLCSMDEVIKYCDDGDQVIVYDDSDLFEWVDHNNVEEDEENSFWTRSVHLIGCNEASLIIMSYTLLIMDNVSVKLTELTIKLRYWIQVFGKLELRDCKIRNDWIDVKSAGSLIVSDCIFEGNAGIRVSRVANAVTIKQSTFVQQGEYTGPLIKICKLLGEYSDSLRVFNIENNTFRMKSSWEHPMVIHRDCSIPKEMKLTGNVKEVLNGAKPKKVPVDKIYRVNDKGYADRL